MSKFLLSILVITNFNYAFCAEGKGGMPQLNPESFVSQLFWLLIFFTILYLIINSVFIPKIKKIREDRDNTVQKLISESKSINDSIEDIISKINNEMKKEKEISNAQINNAINENKEILEKKIYALDKELEKKTNSVLEDLNNSKNKIEGKIPDIVVSLSDQIFEKILGEKKKSNLGDFKKFLEDVKWLISQF